MDFVPIVFGIIGGLALFLYGITLLSSGLQKAAGEKLKELIERLTNNKIKAVGVGAIVTAIIQSSSITTVTLVGLINAGLISLEQAIPIIMGANIGTTVTAQLIAFKIGGFALPVIAIGFAINILAKKPAHKYVGQIILGFGLLFLGMTTMSSGVKPLRSDPAMLSMLQSFGAVPGLGILAGAGFTAIIQSSSATSGLVIAMASEQLLDLNAAIAIIIGANIGTCITVLLASFGATLTSKRAALSHIIFNLIGAAIFFVLFVPFAQLVSVTAADLPRQIANAHLIFNVSSTLIMLPFVGLFAFAVKKILPGKEIEIDGGVKYLDERVLNAPSIAIGQAEKEALRMGQLALSTLEDSYTAFRKNDLKLVKIVEKKEDAIDLLDNAIELFLTKVTQRELSREQSGKAGALVHAISDIERVSDHANNIGELAEIKAREKSVFSKKAQLELEELFKKSIDSYRKAIFVMANKDKKIAAQVFALEQEIDGLTKQFEQNHFDRLKSKKCDPEAGIVFIEVLRNLERISDHAHNISMATIHGF